MKKRQIFDYYILDFKKSIEFSNFDFLEIFNFKGERNEYI